MTVDTERAAWLAGLKVGDEVLEVMGQYPVNTIISTPSKIDRVVKGAVYTNGRMFPRATGTRVSGMNSFILIANTPEAIAAHDAAVERGRVVRELAAAMRECSDEKLQRITAIVNE